MAHASVAVVYRPIQRLIPHPGSVGARENCIGPERILWACGKGNEPDRIDAMSAPTGLGQESIDACSSNEVNSS
jgi:hypothetical protein